MKKTFYIFWGFVLLISLLLTGCYKYGCTDPDSKNYDPNADRDNYSCQYEGKVVIWYGLYASQSLYADGARNLSFFVDGFLVATGPVTSYWTESVACGAPGSITVTVNLGNQKSRSVPLTVRDQSGWDYWKTDLPVNANACLIWELVWSGN